MDITNMNNLRTVTLKMRRRDVIDLLVACTACGESALAGGELATKWDYLHAVLQQQLTAFDEKLEREAMKR